MQQSVQKFMNSSNVVVIAREQLKSIAREADIFRHLREELFKPLDHFKKLEEHSRQMLEGSRRWNSAKETVQEHLPKRGWYLTGEESARLVHVCAEHIENKDWDSLDNVLIECADSFKIDIESLNKSLLEVGLQDFTVNRLKLFLEARNAGNHEVATYIGVPLIDEVSQNLFDQTDFTSKRGRTKPMMAHKLTKDGFANGFVAKLGLVHGDVDPKKTSDENYFNRSAIVHGLMKRPLGKKDSAKTLMIIIFLLSAHDYERTEEQ